jgi:hypothetical protein
MIVVSWSPTTHNDMDMSDTLSTRETTSILFDFGYFEYAIYFFIGIND